MSETRFFQIKPLAQTFTKAPTLVKTCVVAILLAGCSHFPASQQQPRAADPQMVAQPDRVTLMLADAADRAASALQNLAAVEQARTPVEPAGTIPNAPTELRRAVSIQWTGPVEPILKQLANRASYSYSTVGDKPPVPIVVDVNAQGQPVIEVLRSVGLQSGGRAKVVVDSQQKAVELHYAPVNQSGTALRTSENTAQSDQ